MNMDMTIQEVLFWSALIIAVSIGCRYYYEKKRSEKLGLVARKLGFTFSKEGRESTQDHHADFNLFSIGSCREVINEMWGTHRGDAVSMFGYCYIQGSGKNSKNYRQTVLSIRCQGLDLPQFILMPESTIHKISQYFGNEDIDFESFPSFSDKYLLHAEDEEKVREIFTPKVIKFFESNPKVSVEGKGDTLIFYQDYKRCKPDEFDAFYQQGRATLEHFIQPQFN
ncbi:hypothetical protein [Shewanella gelidii]|uniref:DUF3137 domain-containing protein n=1 Tax=Shewanella gelidii TaxID=1642821 RepID=A0A917JNA1_9GAMM|nr:hypothetical protein [Shewanella gelidii]MCL1097214.1 hypothetical protein [Shewanella gelidii]GGI73347.1 hypothetical protein GCM10009332_08590 [Shewanella gelidii]